MVCRESWFRQPELPLAALEAAGRDPSRATMACFAAHAVDGTAPTACSASDFVASSRGLVAALQFRFHILMPDAGPACDLVLEEDADCGLAPEEHLVLLRIAEEAAAQVLREGAARVRVLLRRSRLGPAELSVAGEGVPGVAAEVAASFRSLAVIRQHAARIEARLNVRRLDEGGLFVRCATRWVDGGTGQWTIGR